MTSIYLAPDRTEEPRTAHKNVLRYKIKINAQEKYQKTQIMILFFQFFKHRKQIYGDTIGFYTYWRVQYFITYFCI